jgi:hypothetical protein
MNGAHPLIGVKIDNLASQMGRQGSRRNPKRKNRLPRHAFKQLRANIMPSNGSCLHSLVKHEDVLAATSGRDYITVSYALPCTVTHKATTKNRTHKDSTGRKWN